MVELKHAIVDRVGQIEIAGTVDRDPFGSAETIGAYSVRVAGRGTVVTSITVKVRLTDHQIRRGSIIERTHTAPSQHAIVDRIAHVQMTGRIYCHPDRPRKGRSAAKVEHGVAEIDLTQLTIRGRVTGSSRSARQSRADKRQDRRDYQ
jgi:hypothetical protein